MQLWPFLQYLRSRSSFQKRAEHSKSSAKFHISLLSFNCVDVFWLSPSHHELSRIWDQGCQGRARDTRLRLTLLFNAKHLTLKCSMQKYIHLNSNYLYKQCGWLFVETLVWRKDTSFVILFPMKCILHWFWKNPN